VGDDSFYSAMDRSDALALRTVYIQTFHLAESSSFFHCIAQVGSRPDCRKFSAREHRGPELAVQYP
jgi:hypothetical protein